MREKVQDLPVPDELDDRDLVEFRRAWEKSESSQAQFEPWHALAVAASLDGLWEWDLRSDALEYSDCCAELLGYGKDEIPHAMDFIWSLLHPDDLEAVRAAVRHCAEDNALASVECRLRTKEGEYRWFKARGQAQQDSARQAIRIAGALQDITDRKRAEARTHELLRFEKLLADLSADFVNVASEQLDELIDRSLKMLVESLGNDRSTLVKFSGDAPASVVVHSCAAPGCEAFPLGPLALDQLPWFIGQLRSGKTVFVGSVLDDLPPEADQERSYCLAQGIKSNVSIPLRAGGVVLGALTFGFLKRRCEWPAEVISRLEMIGEVFAGALLRRRSDEALRAAMAENEALRARLERENLYLREQVVLKHHHGRIVGQSDALKRVLSDAEQVAATDTPVLLLGETGTGKELLAQAIHEVSARKSRPMVIVNCASLPGTLVESELFGREAGAYTGAASAQVGRFVVADGSTLFLDEIGEFPIELQAKLLRVLQDGRFERLGSPKTVKVDVRIIAATNRDLEQAVREGKFRADLFHRLHVFPIFVPPLRARPEDIPPLVWAFVEMFGRRMGKTIKSIPRKTMEQLQRYSWPGNVRELSNIIERAMILTTGDMLRVELPAAAHSVTAPRMTLEENERAHVLRVLHETAWRIRGAGGAAEVLAIKPTTLEARMAKLGIEREKRKSNIS